MCYYQPNTAGCTCVFLQLIQPCDGPNVKYYPSNNPSINPKPIVKVCENRFIAKGVGQRACKRCLTHNRQAQSQYQAQRRFSTAGSSPLVIGAAAFGAVRRQGAGGGVIAVGQNAIIRNNGHAPVGNVDWGSMRLESMSQARSPGPTTSRFTSANSSASNNILPSGKRRGESLSRTLAAKRVSRSGPSFSPVSETASTPATRSRSSSRSLAPSVKLVLPLADAPPSLDMVGVQTPLTSISEIGGVDKRQKPESTENVEVKPKVTDEIVDNEIGEMMSLLKSPKTTSTATPTSVEQAPTKKEGDADGAEHASGRPRADSLFDDLNFDGIGAQAVEPKKEGGEETATKEAAKKNDDFPDLSPIGETDFWTMENDMANEPVVTEIGTAH
ncbi:hypothetical protein BJX64DRAFT_284764 [Aspergillus heterothallicus]